MKNLKEHIEDFQAVNEFYEDVRINEAIEFIKRQGAKLHELENVAFQQGLLLTDLKAQLKATNQELLKSVEV